MVAPSRTYTSFKPDINSSNGKSRSRKSTMICAEVGAITPCCSSLPRDCSAAGAGSIWVAMLFGCWLHPGTGFRRNP